MNFIPIGEEEKPRRPSIVPPPKPPRTDRAVLEEKRRLELQRQKEKEREERKAAEQQKRIEESVTQLPEWVVLCLRWELYVLWALISWFPVD